MTTTVQASFLGGTATPSVQKQTAPVTEPQAPPPEEAAKADPMSPKFAALARKERMMREDMRKLAAEREALQGREPEIQRLADEKWKQKIASNFWETALEAGLTPDQLTEHMLNQPKAEDIAIQKLQKKLQDIEAKQNEALTNAQKAQESQLEAARKQIFNEAKILSDGNETYEAIAAEGEEALQAVVHLIEADYKENGVLGDGYLEKAMQEVEDYLLEQNLKRAQLKKVQSKLVPPPTDPEAPKTPNAQKQPINTLTNQVSATPARPLTEKERRQRAMLAFEGKLTN